MLNPMLSATIKPNLEGLRLPCYGSAKIDGIRCKIGPDGVAYSRTLKPIRNSMIQEHFQTLFQVHPSIVGMDGELVALHEDGRIKDFEGEGNTKSLVTSFNSIGNWTFLVFDAELNLESNKAYSFRLGYIESICGIINNYRIKFLEHKLLSSVEEVQAFELENFNNGFEGTMLANPKGVYKSGRSTLNEFYLVKLKRWLDEEAIITGFIEKQTNTNEAYTDSTGHTKRSNHQDGKIGAGTLGKILATTVLGDIAITVGTGKLKHTEAQHIWDNKEDYIGKIFTFKHIPFGAKDAFRHPVFMRWWSAE